jgi:hypothetical protein
MRRFAGRVLVIAAAVGLLAGCFSLGPPAASAYCAPSTPSSAAGYQAAFDHLRMTYTGWITGDGSFPVSLPDGKVLWLFGDTYTGRTNPDGGVPGSAGFIHNSLVLQAGGCFAPIMGGNYRHWSSAIPDPAPNQFYWPAGAVVDGGALRVFVWRIQTAPPSSTAPGLSFQILDMRMASFALPSLGLLGVTSLPFPTGSGVGIAPYGATALAAPDGFVYLYGEEQGYSYVTRTPVGDVATGPWQFFNGSTWSSDPAQAAPMSWPGAPGHYPAFGAGPGPVAQPFVVPYKSGYLLTAEPVDVFSNEIWGFTAPTPAGPWTYQGVIAPAPSDPPSYLASTHFNLPGTTDPVIIYNVNNLTFNSGSTSIFLYGPRFVAPTALP